MSGTKRRSRIRTVAFAVGLLAAIGGTVAYAQNVANETATGVDRFDPELTRGMKDVALALNARERALERREKSITDREKDLRDAEAGLDERLAKLDALREELRILLDQVDEQQNERVSDLVKMMENMRAAQSAALMTELSGRDRDLAVEVLEEMKPMKSGKLLAAMNPIEAAILAERMTEPTEVELP